ncbi:hypothetical protein POPTR_001G440250v4 [Populus trichocarpa]|jgi:hypothetical protein|uniref:Uncharacterized protein n=1 Tax=Populus trichocarpa TaxID=3694 RepID=A0A3N7ENI8_POPTR|nr:hypothetical protein POPTR_001G440250v4 [Populus trichocarpa]
MALMEKPGATAKNIKNSGNKNQHHPVAKVFLTIPDPTANKALSQIKQAPTKTNPTVFLKSPIHSPSANKSCSLLFTIVHGNSQGDSLSLTQNRNNSGGEFQGTRQGGYTSLQPTKGQSRSVKEKPLLLENLIVFLVLFQSKH